MNKKIYIIGTSMILVAVCLALLYTSHSVAQEINSPSTAGDSFNSNVSSDDLIFADGFESGDFSAWTQVVNSRDRASVTTSAALIGNYGMQINVKDTTPVYVLDESPIIEKSYHVRFYFDPNGISMGDKEYHAIFYAMNNIKRILMIEFGMFNGSYKVRTRTLKDNEGAHSYWVGTPFTTISDDKHCIEIDWEAATAAGANNGSLTIWIDGVQSGIVTGIDNDSRAIVSAEMGAIGVLDQNTLGTYYFDAFESRRYSYIGLAGVHADFWAHPVFGAPPLMVSFDNESTPREDISSSFWDFGDGITSTEFSPTHTYTADGTYAVSLTVYGNYSQDTMLQKDAIHVSDLIFADGFESGDFSAWTSAETGGGDLSVTSTAALVGNYGMQVVINDNTPIYVRKDPDIGETRYNARFYFDPNSIAMGNNDSQIIFYGYYGTTQILGIDFRMVNGAYQLRTRTLNDTSSWISSSYYTISDDKHYLEFDWQAASAPGANDGFLSFWIDGVQYSSLTGIDNDQYSIGRITLGAVAGIDTNTRGTYYIDAFESRRASYIGP